MTRSAVYLTKPADFAALGRVVAAHFSAATDKVLIYDDARELDPPYEDIPAGRLWSAYEACEVSVYIREMSDIIGPFAAWFEVETQNVARAEFEDRPLAHAVARGLGQTVVFRDPVPHPYDNAIIEASQIAVDPDGSETLMWLSEHGDDQGRSHIDLLLRSEI